MTHLKKDNSGKDKRTNLKRKNVEKDTYAKKKTENGQF